MEEYFIRKLGCSLRYHDFPGGDIPILFIHGLGCAGSFDYPQVAAQKALQDHRRILVDLLGAGYSDRPENFGYSVGAHADYLAAFVAALGLDHFVLFGHSLGGAVAIELAGRCSDRVEQLVLSESNLDKSGPDSASAYIAGFEMADFINDGFSKLVCESRENGNGLWAASLSHWLPKAAYLFSKAAVVGGTPSWREALYVLDCPRTFLFGENSLPDPDEKVLTAHGIEVAVVPGAGHSMAWENPRGLAETIENTIKTQRVSL